MTNAPANPSALGESPAETLQGRRWSAGRIAALTALGIVSFALHLSLALRLDAAAAVEQQDLFFHADTRSRIECAVAGRCAGRSNISHPNLAVFLNPPIRIAAAIAAGENPPRGWVEQLRHRYTLFVSPIGAALQCVLMFALLLELGLGAGPALLVAALASVSFSSVIFGSIPETFSWSAAAITGAYLLAARRGSAPLWLWLLLAFVATGITVTNLVPIALLFALSRWRAGEPLLPLLTRSAAFVLATLVATLAFAFVTADIYEARELQIADGQRYVSRWMEGNDPVQRALRIPSVLANTVVGVDPALARNYQGVVHDARYKFRFTLDGTAGLASGSRPLALAFVAIVIFGCVTLLRGSALQRGLAVASLAILLFNGVLHAFWGVGPFLYSQHWLPSLLLLAAGGLFAHGRTRVVAFGALTLFTMMVGLRNAAVLDRMLERLTIGGLFSG